MITIDGGTGKVLHNGINITPSPMVDSFCISSSSSSSATPVTSWQRLTGTGNGSFLNDGAYNTGMSLSSGVFTFPQTGRYLIIWSIGFTIDGNDSGIGFNLQTCTDGSTFASITNIDVGDGAGGCHDHLSHQHVVNITDTSSQKIQFASASMQNATMKGGTSQVYGQCVFLRLADN